MQVRATKVGYYGDQVRKPDDEFGLRERKDFSKSWMKALGWDPDADPLDHDGDGTKGGVKTTATGLAALTVAGLREYASKANPPIDLGDARTKADILAAIELAEEAAKSQANELTPDQKIAKAKELSGRDDITTVEQADEILSAAGGTNNDI